MDQVHSIACGLPFWQKAEEEQTNLSIGLRITTVILGIITAIVGVLILFNLIGLSQFGTTVGCIAIPLGIFLIGVGTSIKCIKIQSNNIEEESRMESSSEAHKEIPENSGPVMVELNATQKQILSDFTPQMVEALGGVDRVLEFPIMGSWSGDIRHEHLKAPVMRGFHANGRPFLLFCYLKFSKEKSNYEIKSEYLGRTQDGWTGAYAYPSELNLRAPNPILDNTLAEKYMLDKMSRLMKGEVVGAVEQYPGVLIMKPRERESWRPQNAYLDAEKLEQFMDLDTLFYERKPQGVATDLFLYDPRVSLKENTKLFRQKFPK